jgi:uncharacterized protein
MVEMIRATAVLTVIALLATPFGTRPAFAADPVRESVLVDGTGEVSGVPDTLAADFAVETTAQAIAPALDQANAAAARMRDALVRAGVARADLGTSNVTIGAKVDDHQAIVGYTVNEGLTATIRNLPRAGDTVAAAVAAGGDAARLNSASFGIENDTALLAEARRKAFADARQKAELYARAAGRPLGRVLRVSEATAGSGPVFGPAAAMDARLPIEPGRQRLTVTVTVEWAFGDQPPSA